MSDIRAFGCMSEGIETVAEIISRYEILERLYLPPTASSMSRDDDLLCRCIIRVYSSILGYLAKAKRFWSYNTAIRVAKGIFSGMEQLHTELQSSIQKADDETNRIVYLLESQQRAGEAEATRDILLRLRDEISMPTVRMAQNLAEINDKLNGEQRRETLMWLSSVPCESQHREAARKLVEGTGQWLLTKPEYVHWQKSSSSSFFWLHGIPGAGKSKLASIVIESFLEQYKDQPLQRPPLAYFYCSKKGADSRSRDPLEIMSALLRQLTGSDPSSPLRGSVALEFEERKAKSHDPLRLDLEEVVDHILKIIANDPATLIIDALDEIDEETRGKLFDSLERVVREAHNVVKIFLSSRNDWDILDTYKGYPNIDIQASMNGKDIRIFTECKVQEAVQSRRLLRGRVSQSLRHDIIETLSRKAQGMFRWVELSIETLSNSRRIAVEKDIRLQLGRLPAELHDQYQAIYNEILDANPSTASIAQRAFSWMLAAQRSLSVDEMLRAAAFDNDGYFHEDLDVSGLLDICRNFLMITSFGEKDSHSSLKVFQMAHLSVREFLEQLPEFSSIPVHTTVVSRLLDDMGPHRRYGGQILVEQEPIEPLQDYSIYLFEHAKRSSLRDEECDLAERMKLFLFDNDYKPTGNFLSWIRAFNSALEDSKWPGNSRDAPFLRQQYYHNGYINGGLGVSCSHGLLSILKLLEHDDKAPWRKYETKYCYTGLYAAICLGEYAVAEWLLHRQIYHPDESHGHVPALYTAVWDKNKSLTSLLLHHGADPLLCHERGFSGTPWSMVFWPSLKGSSSPQDDFEIFKEMFCKIQNRLDNSSKVGQSVGFDAKFEGLLNCLQADWTEASEFLILRGANDELQTSRRLDNFFPENERRASSLQIAVRYSQFSVVAALLSHSRDHHSKDCVPSDRLADVKCVGHQLYVNFVDDRGQTALHYLVSRASRDAKENERIMNLLLQHGADPFVESDEGVTALHVAADIGSISLVQRLVTLGLSLDARSSSGASALHFAARGAYQSAEVVRLLTHYGLKPVEKDRYGNTSLHYAAASCNSEALAELFDQLLVEDGLKPVGAMNEIRPQMIGKGYQISSLHLERLAQYADYRNYAEETLLHVSAKDFPIVNDHEALPRGLSYSKITETVDLLVHLGSNINAVSATSKTPLILMCIRGSPMIGVEHVISQGADLTAADLTGKTALHYAASHWRAGQAEILLDAGADIDARDRDLCTPLHRAVMCAQQTMQFLITRGADIESQSASGKRPIHYAAESMMSEAVRMLARKGADVNCVDASGSTALHIAAASAYKYHVDFLIGFGAIVEATDAFERTPLHCAAEYGYDLGDEQAYLRRQVRAWLALYHASEKWCKDRGTRPHTLLKRASSQIIRKNKYWDDFSKVKSDVLAKM